MVDVTGYLLVLFLLFLTGFQIHFIPLETLRVLAAFATCITLLRLINWMRLFEDTSFYVLLIRVTIDDIKYFMLLLIISLLMFGGSLERKVWRIAETALLLLLGFV